MCQLILTLIVVILIIRETFVQEDRQRGLITNGQYQDPRSSPGLEKRERKSCLNRRNRNICVWGKYGSAFCSGTLHVHVLGVL